MRIGVLTFHRSINYGAVTQCYALTTELQKRFPEDIVEVIDYVPKFRMKMYDPSLWRFLFGGIKNSNSLMQNAKILASQILRSVKHPEERRLIKKRYKAFENSLKLLPLSKERYVEDDVEVFRQKVYGIYDVLVVGSDCVWEWSTVSIPNAYYLCGDYGAKKMSFAASAGTDEYAKLSKENQKRVKEALADFTYIGVRDASTEYIVSQACPEAPFFHNCDPTTFLDPDALEPYRQKARVRLMEAGISFDKPIIGVMCNEKLGKLARDIFGDSAQYVGLYTWNRYCDVNLLDLEVLEWASIFGLFNMTITTFFHGTMLSLVNHTPVFSFDYLPETEKQHTKLHELYNRLDLPNFYHRDKRVYSAEDIASLRMLAQQFVASPPKQKIASELEKEAKHCEGFFAHCASLLR